MGQQICLKGLDGIQIDATRPALLRRLGTDAAQFYQLIVEPIDRLSESKGHARYTHRLP